MTDAEIDALKAGPELDGRRVMLETLLKILSWDLPSPTIMIEDDGDLELSFFDERLRFECDISIATSGKINWAAQLGAGRSEHGTDIDRVKTILEEIAVQK